MEKYISQSEKEFKLLNEDRGDNLSAQEIEPAVLDIEKFIAGGDLTEADIAYLSSNAKKENFEKQRIAKAENSENNRLVTEGDIKQLSSRYSENKKEANDFINYLKNKYGIDEKDKINRRNFLKITGTVIGLTIGYAYFKENIDSLWAEFQEGKETSYEIEYSDELTKLYDEACLMPEKEKRTEDLKLRLDVMNDSFKYVEIIQNSEKRPLDEFITDLSEEEFNALLFGTRHNSSPETAAKILDGLIKNGKKFAEMDFEGLSITDSDDTEAVKKFNEKKLSVEKIADHLQENVDSLLVIAKTNSINISGTELNKGFDRPRGFGRFTYISEVVGKAVKTNQDIGIVGFYGGGGHVALLTFST